MVKYEDECCGCSAIGKQCMGRSCPNLNVPHYYCDHCGDGLSYDEVYEVDGEELCEYCLKSLFKKG